MQELIDVIRVSIAADATTDQKAAGVQACRTIATALDTEPGKPLTLPSVARAPTGARLSVDQVLDLVIARLSMLATDRERVPAAEPSTADAPVDVKKVQAPRGLRLPLAPSAGLEVPRRPPGPRGASPRVAARPAPARRAATRKP